MRFEFPNEEPQRSLKVRAALAIFSRPALSYKEVAQFMCYTDSCGRAYNGVSAITLNRWMKDLDEYKVEVIEDACRRARESA